jgi:hypothetical protein
MPHVFISYSRADRPFVQKLVRQLRRIYTGDTIWFDENLLGGQVWWNEILTQIAACDIFIYLLSQESVESKYCQAELTEAIRVQKLILPVFIRRIPTPQNLRNIQIVNMLAGITVDGMTELQAAINALARKIPPSPFPPIYSQPTPLPEVPAEVRKNHRAHQNRRRLAIIGFVVIFITVIAGAVLAAISLQQPLDPVSQALTNTAIVRDATIVAGIMLTTNEAQTATSAAVTIAPTATLAPTDMPSFSATSDITSTGVLTFTHEPSTTPTSSVPTLTVTPRWASGQRLSIHNPNGAWLRGIPDSSSQDVLQVLPDKAAIAIAGETSYDGFQYWWEISYQDGLYIGWVEETSLGEYVPPPPTNTPRPQPTAAIIPPTSIPPAPANACQNMLVSPADNATVSFYPPQLVWNAVPGAVRYTVNVGEGPYVSTQRYHLGGYQVPIRETFFNLDWLAWGAPLGPADQPHMITWQVNAFNSYANVGSMCSSPVRTLYYQP